MILRSLVHKNESTFDYVLNDLKLLNLRLHDLDMTLSGELEKPFRITNVQRFPYNNNSYD